MYFKPIGDRTHIFAEDGEDDGALLRAIVKSSFDSAPFNPHWIFTKVVQLSESEVESLILPTPRSYDDLVVEMNSVHGRFCNTVIHKVGPGHFVLFDKYYKTYRGDPQPMLNAASSYVRSYASYAPVTA